MLSVIVTRALKGVGINMIIFLSAIINLPQDYYDAATVDGANGQQTFRHITMPLLAPTTLLGQKTTTSPYGRDFRNDGYPIRVAEMLATLEGVAYSARVSLHDAKHVLKAKKAIRKAFEMQVNEMGFSIVEVLSACHTNWRVSPLEGQKKVVDEMIPYFPLGVYKERTGKDFL